MVIRFICNGTQVCLVPDLELQTLKIVETMKEAENLNNAETQALNIPVVMPRFVYRLYERGKCRTYEIGELDNPRTLPKEWCDRRLCEGFWGDEESCKKVVSLLNGA
jgi:hypothetical protein